MGFNDWQRNVKTGVPDPTNSDNVRIFYRMYDVELRWNAWAQRQEVSESTSYLGGDERTWAPLTDAILKRFMTLAGDTQHQFRPTETLFRRTTEAIAHEAYHDPVVTARYP